MRERDFIQWIRSQGGINPTAVPVGPGDDCAIVRCGPEKLLVTVDQVLDGVHFNLAEHGPRAAGRKAMARNLSDVAAMASLPLGAVASVALPRNISTEAAQEIYHGMRSAGDVFHCPLIGGDVGVWDGALVISVTVLGRPAGIRPILRSGARPGDAICVTGALGAAWRSRRHLEFLPRINEARILASRHEIHAMIDLSDGLSRDLAHICAESKVAGEILETEIPVHPEAEALATPDRSGVQAALNDGEDYELLFTLPEDEARQLLRDQPLPVKVTRIGTVVAGSGVTIIKPDGTRAPLEAQGWEHKTERS